MRCQSENSLLYKVSGNCPVPFFLFYYLPFFIFHIRSAYKRRKLRAEHPCCVLQEYFVHIWVGNLEVLFPFRDVIIVKKCLVPTQLSTSCFLSCQALCNFEGSALLKYADLSLYIFCRIFQNNSRASRPLQMKASHSSMHYIISQRDEVLICTAVQDSRLYHVTFSKHNAGKCCQKCCFSASSLLLLLFVSLLVSSSLSTKFIALN